MLKKIDDAVEDKNDDKKNLEIAKKIVWWKSGNQTYAINYANHYQKMGARKQVNEDV